MAGHGKTGSSGMAGDPFASMYGPGGATGTSGIGPGAYTSSYVGTGSPLHHLERFMAVAVKGAAGTNTYTTQEVDPFTDTETEVHVIVNVTRRSRAGRGRYSYAPYAGSATYATYGTYVPPGASLDPDAIRRAKAKLDAELDALYKATKAPPPRAPATHPYYEWKRNNP